MSILKPAQNKQAFAKVGIYGAAGSGKSRTATEIAIGLHKAIKSTKPIAVFDTEPAFSWLLPIFEKEGIELLVADESRAFVDLMQFTSEAEQVADIVIVDSITHVWRDLQASYLAKLNATRKQYNKKPYSALEFQHWGPIKEQWGQFTNKFLSSKMHMIVCGRAGSVYEYQDKDDGSGKKELISTGTKMATEKELAYEPSLLIEMIAERDNNKIINTALIQKDRADKLNGAMIQFPSFKKLSKHFDCLNLGGQHFSDMGAKDSQSAFGDYDEGGFDVEKRQREIWSEEVQGLLTKHYPGQTVEHKQTKIGLLEMAFQTRSWTKIENMRSSEIKKGFEMLKSYLEPEQSQEQENKAAA